MIFPAILRWCGNEEGKARGAEWSVIPSELCRYSEVQTGPGPLSEHSDLSFLYNTMEDLGSLGLILQSEGLTFTPAEVDMSIRPGWFWHEQEQPHCLDRLFRTWLTSVGGNCCLNLNIPPDRTGRIDTRDVQRLMELRHRIDESMSRPIHAEITEKGSSILIRTGCSVREIQYIVLREDLMKGQRIDSFAICLQGTNGLLEPLYEGRTVGNRRICEIRIPDAWADAADKTDEVILKIISARGEVHWKSIEVYGLAENGTGGGI